MDAEKKLVLAWIEAMQSQGRGDEELERELIAAYDDDYKASNGCNLVNELRWPISRHPACVVHDRLYGMRAGRAYADRVMRRLNSYFGRPVRGWIRWTGLRLGGWWAYYWSSENGKTWSQQKGRHQGQR